jgi:hypothetical protein
MTSTEADTPVSHTRKQDVIWFYGTIFLGPALVLALGVMVTRRTRGKRRRPAGPGAPTAPVAAQGATS